MTNHDAIGARVSAFADDALGTDDALTLAGRVANGDVSSLELVDAAIARAQAVDEQLNAVSVPDYDRARAAASTPGGGVFGGVPTFIKAISNVAGLPNRFGSAAVPATPASSDSPTVEQIRSTGVVPIGLSTTPEFGLIATTEGSLDGPTRNPWSLDHSAGGSSGGSAALVASGVVPIAHGNDGGGSIRIPASCCGIVGLKPSRDRIAMEPLPKVFPVNLAAEGVLSRTVRDTAAFMDAAERHLPGPGLKPIGHVTDPIDRRLRIGVIADRPDGALFDSVVTENVLATAARLEALGHHVEVIPNPVPVGLDDDVLVLWAFAPFLLWHGGKQAIGEGWNRDALEPWAKFLVGHFRRNSAKAPIIFRRLRKFVANYSQLYAGHDVLLAPTLGGPTHRIGHLAPDVPGEVQMERARQQVPTTWVHNIGGGPSISLPMATDRRGLPMGMDFSADLGEEALLLGLALELEAAHPWPSLA